MFQLKNEKDIDMVRAGMAGIGVRGGCREGRDFNICFVLVRVLLLSILLPPQW